VILGWEETVRAGPARCGGKGYNLARLHRYGFAVPRGGVLPADVYTSFIRAFPVDRFADLAADRTLDAAADLAALRAEIESARLPDESRAAIAAFLPDAILAIRSSAVAEDGATASFAGMHRSVLNVGPAARERAVLACFASLWTPQAIAYRRTHGIPDRDVPCAVVLCEMVPAVAAGVAFSCDPRTGRRDVVVIDAALGPGERVVSGAVTPDHVEIRLAYDRAEILSRRGGRALTEAQEVELARRVDRIQWALGDGQDPQDVEWTHDGRRFWFLQSRPATRVPRHTFEPAKALPLYWSTANIKDAVPGVVSILTWSLIREAIDGILYAIPLAGGYPVPRGMQTVKRIEGRAYFDLTAILWCFYDFAGVPPAVSAASIGGHQPTIPVPPGDPLSGPDGKRRRRAIRKVGWRLLVLPRALRRAIDAQFKAVRESLASIPRTAPEIREAFARLARLHESLHPIVGLTNGYASAFRDPILDRLRPAFGERSEEILTRLSTGTGGVASAEHGYRIAELAAASRDSEPAFRRELERFLADFGHRAVYEADLLNPRWGEDPSFILEQVRRHADVEPGRRDAARNIREEAWAEVKRKVSFWKRPLLAWLLRRVRWGYAARENAKSALAASVWPARRLALECGRLLGLPRPELVFHLSQADLFAYLSGHWDGAGAAELALDREAKREEWLKQPEPPDVVVEGASAPAPLAPAPEGKPWSGIAVAAGCATGKARLVRHPDAGAALRRGEVMVAPSTDPGWTPLFLRASGLVMESGGYLSHGAIVAREYGIPAVVNVAGVMSAARDGETLVVDGNRGLVFREGMTHD
jgi:phosphohistidine swiveling domain-containing protein